MGCFPGDFQEGKRPIQALGPGNGPLRKRPIEGKRPTNANGQLSGTLPWLKTAPLKRSMSYVPKLQLEIVNVCRKSCRKIAKYSLENVRSNLLEGLIFLIACSVHFIRRRFWAISTESKRSRPNRPQTKWTEHASKRNKTLKKNRTLQRRPRFLPTFLAFERQK